MTSDVTSRAPDEPRRRWRWLAAITFAGAVPLLVVTVLGFFGRSWWVFDLLANLRPHLAVALLVPTMVLLLIGRRWLAAVAGAGAAVNIALVAPLLIGSTPPPAAPDAEVLDITFFNVKHRASDPADVIEYLRGRDDDLVVLAATNRRWGRELEAADLDLHVIAGPVRRHRLELTILSRDPNVGLIIQGPAPTVRDATADIRLELDGRPMRVLAAHPVSPLTPQRARQHDAHLAALVRLIGTISEPVIVVGDLNTSPWSPRFRDLLADAGLADSQRAHGIQPSWPAALGPLGLPIDHVLHSPAFTVLERSLGPSLGSDHRAVHARIAFRADG